MRPFLSCVGIFLCHLNLLSPPAELTEGDTDWSVLSLSLGLPDKLCDLFDADGSSLEPQAQKWIEKLRKDQKKYSLDFEPITFPKMIEIPSLVKLPGTYRQLIDQTTNFKCKKRKPGQNPLPNEGSSSPAMCLVCGEIFCVLAKCCNEPKLPGVCEFIRNLLTEYRW